MLSPFRKAGGENKKRDIQSYPPEKSDRMRASDVGHYLTFAEVIEIFEGAEGLSDEQKKALVHAKILCKVSSNEAGEIRDKLLAMKLSEDMACKFADIMPRDENGIIALLSTDRSRIKEGMTKSISGLIAGYLSE